MLAPAVRSTPAMRWPPRRCRWQRRFTPNWRDAPAPRADTDQPLGATLASGTHCFTGDLTRDRDAAAHRRRPLDHPGRSAPWSSIRVWPSPPPSWPPIPAAARRSTGRCAPPARRPAESVARGAAVVGNILAARADDVRSGCDARRPRRVARQCRWHLRRHGDARRTTAAACSFGKALPTHTAFKVTGGGSINVPNSPTVTDPDATGTGFANYGFNGQPGGSRRAGHRHFNYVNHVVAGTSTSTGRSPPWASWR